MNTLKIHPDMSTEQCKAFTKMFHPKPVAGYNQLPLIATQIHLQPGQRRTDISWNPKYDFLQNAISKIAITKSYTTRETLKLFRKYNH